MSRCVQTFDWYYIYITFMAFLYIEAIYIEHLNKTHYIYKYDNILG
jgi:hypothetical protein